jgi:hypothetical protein
MSTATRRPRWSGWARWARAPRRLIGHQRADADLPLSPVDRGAGLRHAGLRCARAA